MILEPSATLSLLCCKCKQWKLCGEFSPGHRQVPSPRGRVCTACNRAQVRAWETANPEKAREKARRTYARNREVENARRRERRKREAA